MPFRLLVIAAVAGALSAPAAASDQVVGTAGGAVLAASAWGGHLVFSQRDPSTGRWALMDATAPGIRALPVATSASAFDADVGPDAAGRPAVVYSRCADEQRRDRCHVVELSLADPGAAETLVAPLAAGAFDDVAPTIWNGRIAFGRRRRGGGRIASIFVQRAPGSRRLERLGRGSVPRRTGRCCPVTAEPSAMNLGPHGLAVVWSLSGGNAFPQEDQELWRIPLDGRRGVLLDVGGAGECGGGSSFVGFASPAIAGRAVSYLRTAGDCYETQSALTTTGPSPLRQLQHVIVRPTVAYAAARDGGRWWTVAGQVPSSYEDAIERPCGDGACTVTLADHVGFTRRRVRRAPVPPLECPGHVNYTCGLPLAPHDPRTAKELRRYLARRFAIFRARRRPIDVLPPAARAALGLDAASEAQSRFLARLGGHALYLVPQAPDGLCLLATGQHEIRLCSSATGFVRGSENVLHALPLPHRRRLFVAVLPDGAHAVRLVGAARTIRLRPYRNTVARVLPARGEWTFTWTSAADGRHVVRFA